jgi:hypothetical protein
VGMLTIPDLPAVSSPIRQIGRIGRIGWNRSGFQRGKANKTVTGTG